MLILWYVRSQSIYVSLLQFQVTVFNVLQCEYVCNISYGCLDGHFNCRNACFNGDKRMLLGTSS